MSHNSVIKGISINDKSLIEIAVKSLQSQGINIELLENTKPRMYFDHQHPLPADICLRLKDSHYDVALDWNSETEEYDIVFDEWAGSIKDVLGVDLPSDQKWSSADKTMSAISKFIKEHNIKLIEKEALEKGYEVYSETNEDGETLFTIDTGNNSMVESSVG